jgi:hypothetical protein
MGNSNVAFFFPEEDRIETINGKNILSIPIVVTESKSCNSFDPSTFVCHNNEELDSLMGHVKE